MSDGPHDGLEPVRENFPPFSVVIPTYNAAEWLPTTIGHLRAAMAEAGWWADEIVVVDDGSTDDTVSVVLADDAQPPVRVVRQENLGRLRAREAGLEAAVGEFVLLCDSRVHIGATSLAFVAEQLREHPDRRIWNGHAETKVDGLNPVSRFWDGIAYLAWRRYLSNPRTTSYDATDYDHYPKGTTLFLAPRSVLLAAYAGFDAEGIDPRNANDDTLLLHPIAEQHPIWISPSFRCTYHPRTTLREFTTHSYHRGTVFIDGHLRPGNRYGRLYLAALALAPVGVIALLRRPRTTLAAGLLALLGLGGAAKATGMPSADAAALTVLTPVFSVFYGAGTLKGLFLRARRR
jgi:hypothetical protein